MPQRGKSCWQFLIGVVHAGPVRSTGTGLAYWSVLFDEGESEQSASVSALGFRSKTSAEVTPDHRKSPEGSFHQSGRKARQASSTIALCPDWWYFTGALENGGNRFPLPA